MKVQKPRRNKTKAQPLILYMHPRHQRSCPINTRVKEEYAGAIRLMSDKGVESGA